MVQCIRTALPLFPCLHLNKIRCNYALGECASDQAKDLESMIFSSFLKKQNLPSSRGFVKISAN